MSDKPIKVNWDQLKPDGERFDFDAGVPNKDARPQLNVLNGQLADMDVYGQCVVSALWLFNGYLDESHTISQSISNREGSFLHGIMHRKEGDFSNSKYWFRKVGDHLVIDSIQQTMESRDVLDQNSVYTPSDLTDWVESRKYDVEKLREIAFLELNCLLNFLRGKSQDI